MGKVTKVIKPNKINEVVLKSYEDVITKRMKAGHDVNVMVNRLNALLITYGTILKFILINFLKVIPLTIFFLKKLGIIQKN